MKATGPPGSAARHDPGTPRRSHVQPLDKVDDDHDDEAMPPPPGPEQLMTDDMRLAVSALGLLRSERATVGDGDESAPHRPATSSTASTTATSDAWQGGTGTTSSPLTTTTSFAPSSSEGGDYFERREGHHNGTDSDPRFIERVSQIPLVSGGLEWYERSKANSRVVKYGAGLVESSLSAVSRPITNNLQLGPLDDFACRQLDRIAAANRVPTTEPFSKNGEQPLMRDVDQGQRGRTPSAERGTEAEDGVGDASPKNQLSLQPEQRSRWQTVLVEAGGLGAAVSEESLKSLRYCLQWLIYATAHLDHQISTLRDFILSLRAHNRSHPSSSADPYSRDPATSHALVAASASAHLTQIKHDVVETIRRVVEVVSKYAGAALPEPAKRYVKQSIMGLPVKWASAIEHRGPGGAARTSSDRIDRRGSENERMTDEDFNGDGGRRTVGMTTPSQNDPRTRDERGRDEEEARAALGPTEEAADRVLTFAVESLDMLRSVANIFGESVEKAEAWIERLRIVGLQRQRQRQEQEQHQSRGGRDGDLSIEPAPPPSTTSATSWDPPSQEMAATSSGGIKRRRGAAQSRRTLAADGASGDGEASMTDGEETSASARRKRGPRSREMSTQ